ncbi:MAG: trypsin-like peptidase domain-containing protein [bacterium]|nr:trypsin-like peptidase domain-containing protein [bacterium]
MKNNSLVINIVAGAVAGAVVSILILNNPNISRTITPSTNTPRAEEIVSNDYEKTVIETVENVQKAVVSIVISKDVPIIEQSFPRGFDPFNDFFGNGSLSPFSFQVPQLEQKGSQKQEIGGGSGFLVSADGMIITNRHVVDQEEAEYTVFLNDGSKHSAKVVARDQLNDIAVIKIDAKDLPFLTFADSSTLKVGQTAIAIGNSLGELRNTVSTGVVSGLSRSITAGNGRGQSEQLNEVIQTDAAINPGNSGGPLLNLSGQVIGVNVAIAQGSQNVGFALPANEIKKVVESVQKTGKITRAYIGVRYTEITPPIKDANNLSVDYGVLVIRGETVQELAVIPGSPANKAGIVEGDIILEIDGNKLDQDNSLAKTIGNKSPGDTVSLKILSKGDEKTVSVKLEESPS